MVFAPESARCASVRQSVEATTFSNYDMPLSYEGRSIGDRISVLHFSNSLLWGGVEEHICGVLRLLSRPLFRAQLVCDPVLYERFRSAIPDDVVITPLALSSPKHVGSAIRFAKVLLRERVRIVHSHMFWSSLFASPLARTCQVPVVVETLHGTEAWRTGWKASGVIDLAIARFVSQYVAVSESDARFLQNKKRVPAKKISIIHNGVDAHRFSVRKEARQSIRVSLGFSDSDLMLIMVARFHSGKGHRVLFHALHELLPVYPNLKLVCLGEGQENGQLRALSNDLGLNNCIRFPGYQRNVTEWLYAADINVLPTYYEGFPLTVLEAMACGLPTVASNVGGIPEAIEDGVSGFLVPATDSHRLAGALAALLSDPARRMQMGTAARQRQRQNFVLEQQVHRTELMYLKLCRALKRQNKGSQFVTAEELQQARDPHS